VVLLDPGHAPYSHDCIAASGRGPRPGGGVPEAIQSLLLDLPDAWSSSSVTRPRDNFECLERLPPTLLLDAHGPVGSGTLLEGSSEGGKVSRVRISLLQTGPLEGPIFRRFFDNSATA
jgi:hypothetical protein